MAGSPVSAEPFRSNGPLASLAHILRGKHDGQQPCGVARQRGIGVVAVIGGNGSGDLVSATRVDGHSGGVPWSVPRPHRSGAGTRSPLPEIGVVKSGRTGGDWVCQ